MRLALIIASLNAGGAQRVLCELANYWSDKGHHVSLITLDPPNTSSFYHLNPMITQINLNQQTDCTSGMRRVFGIIKRLFFLRKAIKNLKPDRIVSFVDMTNLTTLLASMGLKIPVIVSERTHPQYYRIPTLYKRLRNLLYPIAAKLVVQTQSAGNYFNHLKNIQVIPNSVTVPLQVKKNHLSEVQQIISVGRLCPFKGFKTLIRAFANLAEAYPKIKLTIYGEGPERSNLEDLINHLRLEKNVFLPGVTKIIQDVLMNADLFIFPSHYEGFPNALAEAMAVGLPVIASNCSGNIDIVQDGVDGRLFAIEDVDRLTGLMLELIADPIQRERLGIQAKTLPQRFSTASIFSQWDQVIEH